MEMARVIQADAAIQFFNVQPETSQLHQPLTLYESSVRSVAVQFRWLSRYVGSLSSDQRMSVFWAMYKQGRLCHISYELAEAHDWWPLLALAHRRHDLHRLFQAIIDHGVPLHQNLSSSVVALCSSYVSGTRPDLHKTHMKFIDNVINFGGFLCEAGWYECAIKCMRELIGLIETVHCDPTHKLWLLTKQLHAYYWLLECYSSYCQYNEAANCAKICQNIMQQVQQLQEANHDPPIDLHKSAIQVQISLLNFYLGHYDESLKWANLAIAHVTDATPIKMVIDVCRHASKVLVVRRMFDAAALLVAHAVRLAKLHFDDARLLPAPLLDMAFYLMNVDQTQAAAHMYELALRYRVAQFGEGCNLKVSQAHEDLAYALYVTEYSTGDFEAARAHASRAIEISKQILPEGHLLLASSRRIRALILEEVAIDLSDKTAKERLLLEAQHLHSSALSLCRRVFGDENLQTAKHYGNIGRLCQTMHRYAEAEEMHRNAIAIKERLLGANDYEVALSIGHLASLYNYDLERYAEAERLYLRSISIGQQLFGNNYSGLEYDYRGLVHVYSALGDQVKMSEYMYELSQWRMNRLLQAQEHEQCNVLMQLDSQPQPTTTLIHNYTQIMADMKLHKD